MTLQTVLSDLATRVGTEVKSLRTLINGNAANLNGLTTTAKGNLVLAINEIKAEVAAAASSGGAAINDTTPSTTQVYSSSKTVASIAALISDTTPSTTNVYSSSKTSDLITTTVNGILDGAPAALDTLNELAAAIGDNANYAASVTTSLAGKVGVVAQTFTVPEKTQALANIGAIAASSIGDPETNFVTIFEAAIA